MICCWPAFPSEHAEANEFHNYALHESQEGRSLLFPLHRWSHRFFSLSGFGEFPIQAKAQFHEQDLSLSIENRSSFPIMNCNVYFGGRLFAFGNIARRGKIDQKIEPEELGPEKYLYLQRGRGYSENRTGEWSRVLSKGNGDGINQRLVDVYS